MSELSAKYPPVEYATAASLGLTEAEWKKLTAGLARNPNEFECTLVSRLWSDEVSAKRGRMFLRGVFRGVDIDDSRNLASRLGQFSIGFDEEVCSCFEQVNPLTNFNLELGIRSGLGRCVDEILAKGAEPLGLGLVAHVGDPDGTKSREQLERLTSAAAAYSRIVNVPIVISDVFFDARYDASPLVGALAFGVQKKRFENATKSLSGVRGEAGRKVLLYVGSETRREGAGAELRAPEVDPYFQQLLLRAIRQGREQGEILALTTIGVGGLIRGLADIATALGTGIRVYLNQIPTSPESSKPKPLSPLEIALSESAERYLVAVTAANYRSLSESLLRYGLHVVQIGEFISGTEIELQWNHQAVTQLPYKLLLNDLVEKSYQLARFPPMPWSQERGGRNEGVKEKSHGLLEDLWVDLLASPNVHLRSKMNEKVDYTRGRLLLSRPGSPVAVQRIRNVQRKRAIVSTLVSSPRYGRRDPYLGSVHSVARGMRTLAGAGAMPIFAAQTLFAGDPTDYKQLSEFSEIVRGATDACKAWFIPILTDSVRFAPALSPPIPTAVMYLAGVLSDESRSQTPAFKERGDKIFVIGFPAEELGESQFYSTLGKPGEGILPDINFDNERRASECIFELSQEGLLRSVNSIGNGGLAVSLAESALIRERSIGFELDLLRTPHSISREALLFAETASRFVVSFENVNYDRVLSIIKQFELEVSAEGEVGGKHFRITGAVSCEIPLSTAERVWRG